MNRFTEALEKSKPTLTEYSKRNNDKIVKKKIQDKENVEWKILI